MSVLILTPGGFELIRETVRHLRAQTARERIELVVVAPSREALGPVEFEAEGFARGRGLYFEAAANTSSAFVSRSSNG